MGKIFSTINLVIIVIFLLSVSIYAEIPESNELSKIQSDAYILIAQKTGQVIAEKNADKRIYPASTTKILTALVAIENRKPTDILEVPQKAIDEIGSKGMNIGLNNGELVSVESLLTATLVSSANEAANTLAMKSTISYEDFLNKMNETAKDLGAVNSNFLNPSGMHNDNHYTTARDLGLIAKKCMDIPLFKEIVQKKEYQLQPTNKHDKWPVLYSKNTLLRFHNNSDYYEKITGIKTGFTNEAHFNLIGSAINKDGLELIAVLTGCENKNIRTTATKALLEYGFKKYTMFKLVNKNELIKSNIKVYDSIDNQSVDLIAETNIDTVLPLVQSQWHIEKKININKKIKAPVKKGSKLGEILIYRENEIIGKSSIIASNSVEKYVPTYKNIGLGLISKLNISNIIFIPITLFIGLLIFIIYKVLKYKKYLFYM